MRCRLLPLLALALGACRLAPPPAPAPPPPTQDEVLAIAALDMAAGSADGEARLAAAGESAIPFLRPLLTSPDPEVRRKTIRLLLDTGEDMKMSVTEHVQLLLAEIAGDEAWAYSSLRALAAIRLMGEEVEPLVRAASEGTEPEAEAARRLLSIWK